MNVKPELKCTINSQALFTNHLPGCLPNGGAFVYKSNSLMDITTENKLAMLDMSYGDQGNLT